MASQVEHIKWIPGTRFMVDGFAFANPRCSHYFLTHCHSDHTTGLTRSFAGTICCSAVSARLLLHKYGLHAPQVVVLQVDQPVEIAGVTVTALDANHCPGAIMLLFEVPAAGGAGLTRVLHTGDCRWQDGLFVNSCIAHKRVDTLMLDTTYALPRYTFPPQQEAIRAMVEVMQSELADEPDCLFIVGSYHIGKERAFLGAAQALGWKVHAPAAKRKLLQLLDLPAEQLALLTADAAESRLHVGPMASPDPAKLAAAHLKPGARWKRVVAFRPTGWSYSRSGRLQVWREQDGRAAVYGIPYSEHSSWSELRCCVKLLRPKRLIPTVNAATRDQAAAIVERFVDLMDLSSSKGRIDRFLLRPGKPGNSSPAAATAGSEPGSCSSLQQQDLAGIGCELVGTGAASCYAGSSACSGSSQGGAGSARLEHEPAGSTAAATAAVTAAVGTLRDCADFHTAATAPPPATATQCYITSGAVPDDDGGTHGVDSSTAAASGQATAAEPLGAATPCSRHQQHLVMKEQFDFDAVDIAQQHRLLAEAQRLLRLKRTLAEAKSKAAAAVSTKRPKQTHARR